jgi:hypothetical protein
LLEAFDCASALGTGEWEFAVEARCLAAAGLTNTHLRWLLHQGHALQGIERAQPGARQRTFRPVSNLSLVEAACFVLTADGAAYLGNCIQEGRGRAAEDVGLSSQQGSAVGGTDELRVVAAAGGGSGARPPAEAQGG